MVQICIGVPVVGVVGPGERPVRLKLFVEFGHVDVEALDLLADAFQHAALLGLDVLLHAEGLVHRVVPQHLGLLQEVQGGVLVHWGQVDGDAVDLEQNHNVLHGLEARRDLRHALAHIVHVLHDAHEGLSVAPLYGQVQAAVHLVQKAVQLRQPPPHEVLEVLRVHVEPLGDPGGDGALDGLHVDLDEVDVVQGLDLRHLRLDLRVVFDLLPEPLQVDVQLLPVLDLLPRGGAGAGGRVGALHVDRGEGNLLDLHRLGQELVKELVDVGEPEVLVLPELVAQFVGVALHVLEEAHDLGLLRAHLGGLRYLPEVRALPAVEALEGTRQAEDAVDPARYDVLDTRLCLSGGCVVAVKLDQPHLRDERDLLVLQVELDLQQRGEAIELQVGGVKLRGHGS
mmetsp:Transcript_27105/g.61424  ORF Transcript_27105/g.61424 Transcript_27105/m.61424 type:complete len:397 (-) Transcript_27105:2251-3441(-)